MRLIRYVCTKSQIINNKRGFMRLIMSVLTSSITLGVGGLCNAATIAQVSPHFVAETGINTQASAVAERKAAGFMASFAGKTIAPDENVSLTFPSAVSVADGQFAVIVGTEDVTANFRWVSPTQLDGVFASAPLPGGANAMRVYKIAAGNQWVELGQVDINVAPSEGAPQGGKKAPGYRPSLIVGVKSQLAQEHSATATPPIRPTYADVTVQAGMQTEHEGADWSVKSQFNLVGSSYQPEALDFSRQGNNAPQLDLANYLIESRFTNSAGITDLASGNVQAGRNPLLANAINNRGVAVQHKFNHRLDVAAALQNGTAIVGGSNIFGLNDAEHRFATVAAGLEVLERAGGLRLEATSFKGVVKPQVTTGIATLQDAEESHGWGLRAQSTNQQGSLRADLGFARSTYVPKGDSTLNIAPGPSTTGSAWYAELAYDLLKNAPFMTDYPVSLTVQARREYSASTYKSLGAGQGADYINDTVGLNASMGVVTGQLQWGRRSDNVANAAAFLKNRAPSLNLSLAAPLGQMVNSAAPPLWAPTASYTYGHNHSYADTGYIPFGQTIANLPNVKVITHGLGLNWTVDKLNFGYQYSRNLQDNNQPGFELQDVQDLGHNVTASYQLTDNVSFTGGAGKRRSIQFGSGVERRNNTAQAGVNWLLGDRYTLTSSVNAYSDQDSTFTINSKVRQGQLQLLKQFDLTSFGKKLPAQWSLSYSYNNTNSLGIVVRYQTLNAALSLSFF